MNERGDSNHTIHFEWPYAILELEIGTLPASKLLFPIGRMYSQDTH